MKKKLLDESKAQFNEDEEIVIEEPVDEISEEQKRGAFTSLLNDIIKDEFALIEKLNSAIATIDSAELENKEDILTILKTVLDEKNINVGMLTKSLELVDSKSTELMTAGIEKADEIISEPASIDFNDFDEVEPASIDLDKGA